MKNLLFSIGKKILLLASDFVWNYIDKNKDGQLSKAELAEIKKQLTVLLKKIESARKNAK